MLELWVQCCLKDSRGQNIIQTPGTFNLPSVILVRGVVLGTNSSLPFLLKLLVPSRSSQEKEVVLLGLSAHPGCPSPKLPHKGNGSWVLCSRAIGTSDHSDDVRCIEGNETVGVQSQLGQGHIHAIHPNGLARSCSCCSNWTGAWM